MVRRRGGGIFTDDITGNWTGISKGLFTFSALIIAGLLSWFIYFLVKMFGPKDSSPQAPSGGGAVAPPYSKRPGRINIAEVAQAPSAGQGIIYFSQAEEEGVLCDTCTAEFNINITYSGGTAVEPQFKKVTSPSTNGVARFDYSVPTPSQPTPSQNIRIDTTPPTSMQVDITARSIVPGSGIAGGTTTFSKTLPYVA